MTRETDAVVMDMDTAEQLDGVPSAELERESATATGGTGAVGAVQDTDGVWQYVAEQDMASTPGARVVYVEDSDYAACECGCGEATNRRVPLLREHDVGTAQAVGWSELSVAPMRVPVACVEGHEAECTGYVTREAEG